MSRSRNFPKVLINFSSLLDLKRFSEMRWTKLTNIVEFPTGIAELDLTPYASESMDKHEPPPIYSLYGISNHMGEFCVLFLFPSFRSVQLSVSLLHMREKIPIGFSFTLRLSVSLTSHMSGNVVECETQYKSHTSRK